MPILLADPHVHSWYSDDCGVSATRTLDAARRRGVGEIAITDHNTMDGVRRAQKIGEQLGVVVIPGVEMTSARGTHLIGLGLPIGTNLPDRRRYTEQNLVEMLRQLGCWAVIVPHPYLPGIGVGEVVLHQLLSLPKPPDAVEVLIGLRLMDRYQRELEHLCRQANVAPVAGSDSHFRRETCTRLTAWDSDQAPNLRTAIEKRITYPTGPGWGWGITAFHLAYGFGLLTWKRRFGWVHGSPD